MVGYLSSKIFDKIKDIEFCKITYVNLAFENPDQQVNLILELSKILKKDHKLVTVALPNNSRFENITQKALRAFDFLNIMSYDNTGSWTPENLGHHSSYENSEIDIEF